ncbi:hypothetical protein VKT23_001060 [Stygiomarasmius scandens]|uniref:YCII-related domain-containing protein n=1 Tax=Marasmiellus scandens TaxID=2682957 RepID=A0ABR1K7V8_9AGAR
MSTTAVSEARPKFLVYAPDKTEEGTFERRLTARPDHLVKAKENISSGFIRVGGALVSPDTYQLPDKKMVGSAFICEADNIEDVRKQVEDDVYYKNGIWDPEKIVILPIIPATPIP